MWSAYYSYLLLEPASDADERQRGHGERDANRDGVANADVGRGGRQPGLRGPPQRAALRFPHRRRQRRQRGQRRQCRQPQPDGPGPSRLRRAVSIIVLHFV